MFKVLLVLLSLGAISTTGLAQSTSGSVPTATAAANPSPADVEAYIKAQTVKGGELDFSQMLATRKQSMFLHQGAMYNKQEYALVLWGMRAKALGVPTADKACALFAAANNRPISNAEKQALTSGFDSGTRE
ncbi:hypothetical protein [Solirubrum puertoriconensis]|uniref:Uncharacterized protein n=1 Tax=Solirubrum puertoriconensis TaxID=1751427 RepID=A0A9X0HKE0_SOLP1|nr:hypothetical protein [Solirubrum puertoriconensis]KUG07534.1 hypothetical protein ASU33_14440 [Solirubrum puertoriconensis]